MKKKTLQKQLSFEVRDLSVLNADQSEVLAGGQMATTRPTCFPDCKPTVGSVCATACGPLICQA